MLLMEMSSRSFLCWKILEQQNYFGKGQSWSGPTRLGLARRGCPRHFNPIDCQRSEMLSCTRKDFEWRYLSFFLSLVYCNCRTCLVMVYSTQRQAISPLGLPISLHSPSHPRTIKMSTLAFGTRNHSNQWHNTSTRSPIESQPRGKPLQERTKANTNTCPLINKVWNNAMLKDLSVEFSPSEKKTCYKYHASSSEALDRIQYFRWAYYIHRNLPTSTKYIRKLCLSSQATYLHLLFLDCILTVLYSWPFLLENSVLSSRTFPARVSRSLHIFL